MQDMDQITPRERLLLAGVLCVVGVAMLASGCWSGSEPPPFVPQDAPTALQVQQKRVIDAVQLWYPIKISKIIWAPCGENSYYLTSKNGILLCTEMEAHPEAGIFFAAHEVGHATAWQLAGTLDEEAADEIGALALVRLDMVAELVGAATYEAEKHEARHLRYNGHPSDNFRAWNLACLAEGSFADGAPECRALYASTKDRWDLRLTSPQVDPARAEPPPEVTE